MPIPVRSTTEYSTTAAGAWKKLFQAGESSDRTGVNIRARSDNAVALWIAIVPRGIVPAEPASSTDEIEVSHSLYAGDTFPLGSFADGRTDVYVRAPDGSAIGYRAWEVKGK